MLNEINVHTLRRGSHEIAKPEELHGTVILCISPLYEPDEDPADDIVAIYEIFDIYRNNPNFSLFYCVLSNNFTLVNPHIMGSNKLVTKM